MSQGRLGFAGGGSKMEKWQIVNGGMYSGPEIHGFSQRRITVRFFWDFSTETEIRQRENAAGRKVSSQARELGCVPKSV